MRWVLVLVVAGGLVYAFRDSFTGLLETKVSAETPRGAIRLFTQGLIDRNEAAVLAHCKADVEEQDRFKKKNWSPDCKRHETTSDLCTL